jgi:hypothetical protein
MEIKKTAKRHGEESVFARFGAIIKPLRIFQGMWFLTYTATG